MTALNTVFHYLKGGVITFSDLLKKIWHWLRISLLKGYWKSLWIFSTKRTYKSIYDTPIIVWDKIKNNEDWYYLFKNCHSKIELKNYQKYYLNEIYLNILDEQMRCFEPKKYIELLKLEMEIELLRFKAYKENKRILFNTVAIKQAELENKRNKLKEVSEISDVRDNIVAMIKNGISIKNISELSMYDYLTFMNHGK